MMTPDEAKEEAPGRGEGQLKLPNMNEFSPGVLGPGSLRHVLELVDHAAGDKESAIAEIEKLGTIRQTTGIQKRKRAANVLIGMSQCGLVEKAGHKVTATLSPLGKKILACATVNETNSEFAKHLLQNCHGLQLIDVVQTVRMRLEPVDVQNIRDELRVRGYAVTENEGNPSKIRAWLEEAGVIDAEWNVDEAILKSLIGATSSTVGAWGALDRPQRVFLEETKLLDLAAGGEWISVRHIKRICEAKYGRSIFPEGRLREDVIDPLKFAGWIEVGGIGKGRGGDSGNVKAEAQLRDLVISLPIDVLGSMPPDLRSRMSTPLSEILRDLKSADTYKKGLALELLALRLTRDIGLFPVCFRERSNKTQGAEVDLVANGVHLCFSRWLVQCKNAKTVHVDDLAKEVGMAVVLKAHVIVLVTTGNFTKTVTQYANGLASSSALQTVLIDRNVLQRYAASGGSAVIDWCRKTAYDVLALKRSQVLEID
jgi:Restriction endonuclease